MPEGRGRRAPRLSEATLTPQYRRHLREAGVCILWLAAALGCPLTSRTPARLVDRRLEAVVNNAYRDGEKLYWITLGVLSVQRAFKLSGAYLKSTWSAIRAWRLLQPIQPRIPMTWYVLQCLLVVCLARGNAQRGQVREEWWGAMVAFWLAFIGMLRPGEVDQLRVGDFCFPEMPELAEGVGLVISIRQTKTRRVWATQFVIVDSRELVEWCRWWTEGKKPKDRFLSLSRRRWAQILVESLEILHLDSCGFTLGSLRGGGACHHFKTQKNLGLLQFAGRWRRPETLRHYLQEALGIHALAQAPPSARAKLLQVYEQVPLLSAPPPSARTRLL